MLQGKIALVTGASRGIGRAIALSLAKQGALVVINYNGSQEKAGEVAAQIKAEGGECETYQCDVSDGEAVRAMIDSVVKRYGALNILVNNAGITKDGLIMKMSEDDFDKVLSTNLKGAFHCCKSASRQMLRQKGGRIINMASVVGITGNAGQANYAASKAGVIGLTKSLAKELGSRGVTVNAIAPGFIKTDMTEVLPEDTKKQMEQMTSLKRLGEAEDVANLAAFLASDQASYITGQVLSVDGGMA